MITHCPHCHTEFTLEDSDVPAGGLSIQCASCKQIFGVLASIVPVGSASPPPPEPSAPSPTAARPAEGDYFPKIQASPSAPAAPSVPPLPPGLMHVRRESGELLSLNGLTTLKRWVTEGRVERDDLLTQDGVTWQRLGNMRPLIPLFTSVAPQRPDYTVLVEREPFLANPARPDGPLGRSANAEGIAPPPLRPHPSRTSPAPPLPASQLPLAVAEPPRRQTAEFAHDRAHPFHIPITHVHRDHASLWRRRRFLWRAAAAVGAVGVLVAITFVVEPRWFYRAVASLHHGQVSEAAVAQIQEGYAQLYQDSSAALQAASQAFKQAVAIDDHYAEAFAGLAEVELALAENAAQLQHNVLRNADKKKDHTRIVVQATEYKKQNTQHLQAALEAAQQAMALASNSVAANRAMALYHEVLGTDLTQAAPYLRRARATAPDDVRVLYATVNNGTYTPKQAIALYNQIVSRMPQFNRARYKLARLYLQESDPTHALEQLEAILASAPTHELARSLVNDVSHTQPPSNNGPWVASSMPNQAEDTSALPPSSGHPAAVAPPPPGASFEVLVHQGQLLRATHQTAAAAEVYARAVGRDGHNPAGHIGLGWCELEMEQPTAAVAQFTRAVELAPWSVEGHYGLAEALRAQGDMQQAVKQYRQVLVIEPDGAMGRLARQVLDEISR